MATRTISNTGGNYNSTGTWVEGVVPTSADDVVATATSGQLTISATAAALSANFTNYTNTLTMNAVWTISGTTTTTFVSAMTISGASNIALTGTGATLVTNGKLIPNLSITGNKTLSGDLNITNLTSSGSCVWSGTATINVSGNLVMGNIQVNYGNNITLNMIGTGTMTGLLGFLTTNINTSGTINMVANAGFGVGLSAGTNLVPVAFNYISGTITGTKIFSIQANVIVNTLWTMNTGGMTWDSIVFVGPNSTNTTQILTLNSNLNFTNDFVFTYIKANAPRALIINGVGKINGGRMLINSGTSDNTTSPSWVSMNYTIKFGSTASHTLTELSSSSVPGFPNVISSQTASTTAYLGVSGTQSIFNTTFTDIDATTGPISTFRSTLTRTTAITNYTSFGGGGGSFTYLN